MFAGDAAEGEQIARRIEAGHCNVNDVLVNYNVLGLPMGGWKNSGIGTRHGAQGIRRFCHTEALTIPRLPPGQVRAALVPLQRPQTRSRSAPVPVPQRPRAAQPARALAPRDVSGRFVTTESHSNMS